MPLEASTKQDIIKAIKSKQGTEKVRLVGLYKQLLDMYEEDHKYTVVINKSSFETHEKIRSLANKAIQIMRNHTAVVTEDLVDKDDFFTKEEQESESFKKEAENQGEVANFWLDLLMKIPRLSYMISDKDKEVLAYLDHIEILRDAEKTDCRIELTFKENEFFTNQKLVIESVTDEENDSEIVELKSEGINWKEGKNYLVSVSQKKVGNKKGKKKTVEKETRNESFFWIFKNFNSSDFEMDEEEDLGDYDMEPTSDRCLFDMGCDFVETMANDFLVYFIPSCYGIKVANLDDECGDEDCAHDHDGPKPQNCKQQ